MLIAFNKPYGVLTQFRASEGRSTLADYLSLTGIHPAGRLDRDSEGLLLLTDDGRLQHEISSPMVKAGVGTGAAWHKIYVVQVEGVPTQRAIDTLRRGVRLNDGLTLPAQVKLLARAPRWLWSRRPPIRQRQKIPTTWLQIQLSQGRNRQVRRMTAAVGFPTLRLIRERVGSITVEGLQPGEWRQLEQL